MINTNNQTRKIACAITLLFFACVAQAQQLTVTLHPGPTVTPGQATVVSFGIPLPAGTLSPNGSVQVLDASGAEVPINQSPILLWYDYETSTVTSIRTMLVHAQVAFDPGLPTERLTINVGASHGLALAGSPPAAHENWVPISADQSFLPDEYDASEQVLEPAVYATFDKQWLAQQTLRTKTVPVGEVSQLAWFDNALQEFGRTAVNDVSPLVTGSNRINYQGSAAPWLFDRALTLFNIYFRTGDVKWLRHGHRAAQFYANHLTGSGHFDLKNGDRKYSYAHSMLVDMALTGDLRLLEKIPDIASAQAGWSAEYSTSRGFWTERHHTYALLGALADWETTGGAAQRQRLQEMMAGLDAHVFSPPAPLPADGCAIHEYGQHEGGSSGTPTCSPWMSALLADALQRVYEVTGDETALEILSRFGDFIDQHALFTPTSSELSVYLLPFYLISSQGNDNPTAGLNEWEHTCDVWGMALRGIAAKRDLGQSTDSLSGKLPRLEAACQGNLDYWHRPGAEEASGRATWRLSPPRKFSWWFGTTLDLPLLYQGNDADLIMADGFE